jgi:hypothetical protein
MIFFTNLSAAGSQWLKNALFRTTILIIHHGATEDTEKIIFGSPHSATSYFDDSGVLVRLRRTKLPCILLGGRQQAGQLFL